MRILIGALVAIAMLAGCDGSKTEFPVKADETTAVNALATNVTVVRLTAENIHLYSSKRNLAGSRTTMPNGGIGDYRVGEGDILDIVVWDHPDLTMPAGERRTPQESGLRVQSDGTFFYPYVGQVPARGKTAEQIRADLTERLSKYIPDPQAVVRVVGYNSSAVSVTGEVRTPRRQPLTDVQLTLLDAVDAAGGLTPDADPRRVTVRRGGRAYQVDLQAFLKQGVGANNPVLRAGDVVSVPKIELQEAYLLGQLVKADTINLTHDNITLTQAVTRVGGLKEEAADARGIFVFRAVPAGHVVFQLDASNPVAYLVGGKFVILPGDVIYVTSSPIHRWNRLVSGLLPTMTAVRTTRLIEAGE